MNGCNCKVMLYQWPWPLPCNWYRWASTRLPCAATERRRLSLWSFSSLMVTLWTTLTPSQVTYLCDSRQPFAPQFGMQLPCDNATHHPWGKKEYYTINEKPCLLLKIQDQLDKMFSGSDDILMRTGNDGIQLIFLWVYFCCIFQCMVKNSSVYCLCPWSRSWWRSDIL